MLFCISFSYAGSITPSVVNKETNARIVKIEKKRKKGGWQERMRQRIHKLLKAHDTFLLAFLICLFLLALSFMLGVYWIKNIEVLNALNYVSLGLVIVTAFFAILWLMTVNMRKHP
jgi:hypothetical protein